LAFTQNQNMDNRMEKGNWQNKWMGGIVMGKCKNRQRKSFHTQTNCKHFQGGYGGLQFDYVYVHVTNFFKEYAI
jgi:hypothetical protein